MNRMFKELIKFDLFFLTFSFVLFLFNFLVSNFDIPYDIPLDLLMPFDWILTPMAIVILFSAYKIISSGWVTVYGKLIEVIFHAVNFLVVYVFCFVLFYAALGATIEITGEY